MIYKNAFSYVCFPLNSPFKSVSLTYKRFYGIGWLRYNHNVMTFYFKNYRICVSSTLTIPVEENR